MQTTRVQSATTVGQARQHRRAGPNPILIGLLVAFLIAGSITAYLTYVFVRDITLGLPFGIAPTIAVDGNSFAPTSTVMPGTPAPTPGPDTPLQVLGPTPEPWDGAGRVTILVMGYDYGDWNAERSCPCRTDTMILLTVDPIGQSIGMLNIPRDLWVQIPGFEDYYKINMANYLGDGSNLPGGGAGLAMETVEQFLGVPINFYALVDFTAFERVIDEIGGIDINVPDTLTIDPIVGDVIHLEPGWRHFTGPEALAYARARYTEGGDFDRGARQQQVIEAIRDKVVKSDWGELVRRAPALYQEISSGLRTNMTFEQALKLGWTGLQIPKEKWKKGVISPPDQVLLGKSPDGTQDIVIPVPNKIRELRDEIFTDSGLVSPLAATAEPAEMMRQEAARVAVRNGSSTDGLAGKTQEFLKGKGINITEAGNADQVYYSTVIYDYTGKPYTVKYLMEIMGISEANVYYARYDPNSQVDVVVILGTDWAANNTMP